MLKKHYADNRPLCRVTFTLPREAARGGSEVRILGEFNDWSWERGVPMDAGATEFTANVELATGADYQFRYLIDNHIWENDWHADNYLPTPFGVYNSVISLRAVVARAAPVAGPAPAPAPVATNKAAAKPAAKAPAKPAAKASAKPDDLTQIEGIGPKISALLQAAGIQSFAQLATADVSTLRGILEAAGKRYQLHDPSSWPQQSQLAASGDWAALTTLQGQLKGGRR